MIKDGEILAEGTIDALVDEIKKYVKKADEVVWHCLEASSSGSYPNIIVGDGKKHIIVGPGLGSDSYSNLTISIRGILVGHKHGDDASFYYIPGYRQNIQFGSTDGSVRQNFIFTQEQRNNLYKIPATYRITETYSGISVGTEAELITENYLTQW